jgi:hypothetical protein
MAAAYPIGRTAIEFRPAFTGTGDLDHEGPTRRAYLTDVYGLVIHTSVISNMAPKWTVAHTRSGYAVGYASTWLKALTLADRLGECGTWNRDRSAMEADADFGRKVNAVLAEHGERAYRRPNPLA